MSKREKLIKRLLQKPSDMRFAEIDLILKYFGFSHTGTKGSHFIYERGGESISIVKHGKNIKKYTLEELIELLNLED